MKLYSTPGFTSLADHIAMLEADLALELVNPTGYAPALVFDDGEVLTENVAILT